MGVRAQWGRVDTVSTRMVPGRAPAGAAAWPARVMARCLTAVLSVQVLCAKQGLRLRRRLTRANVKEKVKETRKVLEKLHFMAQEVQGEARF